MTISEKIKNRIKSKGKRFFSNDNISEFIESDIEKAALIDEVTEKAEGFLQSLIIDTENDPNAKGTARRIAKMYVEELFSGRYEPEPNVTAFPNEGDDSYQGMLVIRADIKSICSHHHQPVSGVAYIGIIPNGKVLGLSKYIRLAQWEARRGTLQEELCTRIADAIQKHTGTENVAVYIQATHGCCENRGVKTHNSLTQTTVLRGGFKSDPSVREEFYHNLRMQSSFRAE